MRETQCLRSGGIYIAEPWEASSSGRVCFIPRNREECEADDVKEQCIFQSEDK